MSEKAKVFTAEYRAKVVELSYQRNNIRELADELGIRVDLIYKWRTADRRRNGLSTASSLNKPNNDKETAELRRQLRQAQMENEILKKALRIFSVSDGKSSSL